MHIGDVFTTAEEALALSHAQMAKRVLLRMYEELSSGQPLSRYRGDLPPSTAFHVARLDSGGGWSDRSDAVLLAWNESWAWAIREVVLVPIDGSGHARLSRAGLRFLQADAALSVQGFRIDREAVHPAIRDSALQSFWRQSFDTAVFECFKAVEVSVRSAAGLPNEVIGAELMRKAFAPDSGPLADTTLPRSEQESMAHLFAGAIGLFKNPNSHRYVFHDATTAADMIAFASYLLRLVDARSPSP